MKLRAPTCQECECEIVPGGMLPICPDCYDLIYCPDCDTLLIDDKCVMCSQYEGEERDY